MNIRWRVLSILVLAALIFSACTPAAATQPPAAEPTAGAVEETTAPAQEPPAEEMGDRIPIRWFVGLGTGTDPGQPEREQAVVDEFNASQDKIQLILELVVAAEAPNTLTTQIAGGNAPDIVGPVGFEGQNRLAGQWLDLADLIAEYDVDLSNVDPALVKFYDVEGQGQIGLPFAVYPSFMMYNRDLFDEAGLPYPPQTYGDPYIDKDGNEKEWNWDTVRELAIELTVDENGNTPASPDFDPEAIVQFGFEPQWNTETRAFGTLFGPGTLSTADNKAQIPDVWADAWNWLYDAIWEDHFVANDAYRQSDEFGQTNMFSTGKVAMGYAHLWYTCCIDAANVPSWDLAIAPSYNGVTTAKLHADTFGILKSTEHPKEAFEVLQYLLSSEELLSTYAAFPADTRLQEPWLEQQTANFAPNEVNWQVAIDSLAYADNPGHEGPMPNFAKSYERLATFFTDLSTQPDLDLDAEIEKLREDLQVIFDEES